MELKKSRKMSKTCYGIADLILEFNHPIGYPLKQLLPSFQDFILKGDAGQADISVDIHLGENFEIEDLGILLTDESIIWDDRFRFYEKEDSFITTIISERRDAVWLLRSDRNFEKSELYIPPSTLEEQSDVIAWMAMMIFGQASILHQTIMIHASVVEHEGKAVAFLGKSGTGKSTHSRLWLEHIPGTALLNDDNPAIRMTENGVFIYGTPWSGKTACYINKMFPLQGLVRLGQASRNEFRLKTEINGFITVLPSCTSIRWNKQLYSKMNTVLAHIIVKVPVGYLKCLPDAAAVELCRSEIFLAK